MSASDTGYRILESDDYTRLRDEVNHAIGMGWFVHGNLVVVQMPNRLRYFQVMVKRHAILS